MSGSAVQLLGALAVDAAIGYPHGIYRKIRHPVVWMGNFISSLEARWNHGSTARRRLLGCLLMLSLLASVGVIAGIVQEAIHRLVPAEFSWLALTLVAIVASTALAQRSLHDHLTSVARPLAADDLPTAREAVGKIVGRDTADLDERGVSAAAIESLAESFCDGIVAPAFWLLVGGLPGVFIYKAVNTADSLIGHREERYRAFGWCAARTDDLMNLLPARIAGLLLCIGAGGGLRTMLRDASRHASPNAGWTEAAMAGALRRELGGGVSYDGVAVMRPLFGAGPRPDAADLVRALRVYRIACLLLWLIVGVFAWRW